MFGNSSENEAWESGQVFSIHETAAEMQTLSWTAKDFGFDMEWPRFGKSRCNASNQPLLVPEDASEEAHY